MWVTLGAPDWMRVMLRKNQYAGHVEGPGRDTDHLELELGCFCFRFRFLFLFFFFFPGLKLFFGE